MKYVEAHNLVVDAAKKLKCTKLVVFIYYNRVYASNRGYPTLNVDNCSQYQYEQYMKHHHITEGVYDFCLDILSGTIPLLPMDIQ